MRFVRDLNVGKANTIFSKAGSSAIQTPTVVEEEKAVDKVEDIDIVEGVEAVVSIPPVISEDLPVGISDPVVDPFGATEEVVEEPVEEVIEAVIEEPVEEAINEPDLFAKGGAVEDNKLEERFAIPNFEGFEKSNNLPLNENIEATDVPVAEEISAPVAGENFGDISEAVSDAVVEDVDEAVDEIYKPESPSIIEESIIDIEESIIDKESTESEKVISDGNDKEADNVSESEPTASETWDAFIDNVIVPTLGVCVDKLKEFIMTKLVDDLKGKKKD